MNAAKKPPTLRGGRLPPAAAVPIKKEEDVDTDDERCTHHTQNAHEARDHPVVKKEEGVDTDDELQNIDDAAAGAAEKIPPAIIELEESNAAQDASNELGARGGSNQRRALETFKKRVEELKAYKAKHGHANVKRSADKSLAKYCDHIRHTRDNLRRKGLELTEGRVASLDAIGFEWSPQNRKEEQFQERLQELTAYKAEHGHLNVKWDEDKSLYGFCVNTRHARNHPERSKTKLTEERIASFDALGFEWEPQDRRSSSDAFEERLKALRAYKAERGHLNVKRSEDKSLADFCKSIRRANKGEGTMKLDDGRIAALDALGFDWEQRNSPKSFQERIEELEAYKAKYGHLNVKRSEDKSLNKFCANVRQAHNGKGRTKLTAERIASLDALGFDWTPEQRRADFSR